MSFRLVLGSLVAQSPFFRKAKVLSLLLVFFLAISQVRAHPSTHRTSLGSASWELMRISVPTLSLASFICPAFTEDITTLQITDLIVGSRDSFLSCVGRMGEELCGEGG